MFAESWTIRLKVGKGGIPWSWRSLSTAALFALCLLGPLAYFWGFTVDDAWIISRVAHCFGVTGEAAFNCGDVRSEAVTPFGFAELIAFCGRCVQISSNLGLFQVARGLGLGAWVLSHYLSFKLLEQSQPDSRARLFFIGLMGLSLPGAAWATAGLSAPICGLMLLLSERAQRKLQAKRQCIFLVAATSLRPELLPFAVLKCALSQRTRLRIILFPALILLGAVGVASLRFVMSGSALPLSFTAKTPSLDAGLAYAWGSLWFASPLLTVLLQKRIYSREAHYFGFSLLLFFASLVFAGGDWMPMFRLSAPLAPLVCFYGAQYRMSGKRGALSFLPSLLASTALVVMLGADSRATLDRRLELVAKAKPLLHESKKIAAVDIGWVGLASSAPLFDLAGVTEPDVAGLAGSHTDKWITTENFEREEVETWIIRLKAPITSGIRKTQRLPPSYAYYGVDQRLLKGELADQFTLGHMLQLKGMPAGYLILNKKTAQPAEAVMSESH